MTAEDGTEPARERGWSGPLGAVILLGLATTQVPIRAVVPVEGVLLLVAPALAACSVAGWRAGGRLPLALLWTAFAAWVVVQSPMPGLYGDFARGWAVLLGLVFGLTARTGIGEGFLPKALLALVLAAAAGLGISLVALGGFDGVQALVTEEVGRRVLEAVREWKEVTGTPEMIQLARESEGWANVWETMRQAIHALPDAALPVFPALLCLQSLASLALGWAVYHRVSRARLGPPLARLRDLQFDESLVWGVVAGLVLLVLPLPGMATVVALNLLLFFGVLYALRGVGVLLWFLSPGPVMSVVWVLFTVMFGPVVLMVSAGLGLGDTWFDWRRIGRGRSQRSE